MSCARQFSSQNKKAYLAALDRIAAANREPTPQEAGCLFVHLVRWPTATSVRPSNRLPGACMPIFSRSTLGMCRQALPSMGFAGHLSN